jgi:hypothetical protein
VAGRRVEVCASRVRPSRGSLSRFETDELAWEWL